jgi:hypothetical protein
VRCASTGAERRGGGLCADPAYVVIPQAKKKRGPNGGGWMDLWKNRAICGSEQRGRKGNRLDCFEVVKMNTKCICDRLLGKRSDVEMQ